MSIYFRILSILVIVVCSCRHHHVMQPALIIPHHPSQSSITFSRSSRLHPVSVEGYCKQVLTGPLTLAHLCEGVYWRTSLMSSSLILNRCPAWLIRPYARVHGSTSLIIIYHLFVVLLAGISLTLSFTIRLFYPSFQAGLPDYILYPYRAVSDKF